MPAWFTQRLQVNNMQQPGKEQSRSGQAAVDVIVRRSDGLYLCGSGAIEEDARQKDLPWVVIQLLFDEAEW